MQTFFLETNPPDSGSVYYMQFWNESGQAWNGSAFATYDATRDNWDFPMSEIGATGVFTLACPSFSSGTYVRFSIKKQVGGSPSHTDDPLYSEGSYLYSSGGLYELTASSAGLTAQQTRDAMQLAPSSDAEDAPTDSVDELLLRGYKAARTG